MPYFSLAMHSIPSPKAKPVLGFGFFVFFDFNRQANSWVDNCRVMMPRLIEYRYQMILIRANIEIYSST